MAMMFHGIMDEQYLDGLSDKVHRGQEGRVLKSFNPDGRIFGYNNIPIEDPTRQGKYGRPAVLGVQLELNPGQATVVRRIFIAYASGMSMDAIAGMFNAEGIPPPQPPKNRPDFGWCHTGIRAMLRNDRYRGGFVWNKTRKARDPETRKKVTKQRPPDEWVIQEIPEWRIVTEEQWAAVQERIRVVNRQRHPSARRSMPYRTQPQLSLQRDPPVWRVRHQNADPQRLRQTGLCEVRMPHAPQAHDV